MDNALMTLCAVHENSAKTMRSKARRNANLASAYSEAVARRNERERNRVREVNNGFVVLRQRIPFAKSNKKMSKVETLRSAVDYIRHLQKILSSNDSSSTIGNRCMSTAAKAFASKSDDRTAFLEDSPSSSTSSHCNSSLSSPGPFTAPNFNDFSSPSSTNQKTNESSPTFLFQAPSSTGSHSSDNLFSEMSLTFTNSSTPLQQQSTSHQEGTWFDYY